MAKKAQSSTKVNVLFIGNSFTARNDLPGLIARLAEARGRIVQHSLINVGGASLRTHWNAGAAIKVIHGGTFDRVVLQEQSTLPVKNAGRMHENVRLLNQAIKAAGAKTVLYMTWARLQSPESQRAITDAYESIGRELGTQVVPVGVAWQAALGRKGAPVLHDKDGSHPTLAGSYLAAAVFYAALFNDSPVGIDVEVAGLGQATAARLQQAAWQACKTRTNIV